MKMEKFILKNIPVKLRVEKLAKLIHVKPNTRFFDTIDDLVKEAERVALPKGMFAVGFHKSIGDDLTAVENYRFKSRVLKVNLEKVHRIFLFVATCGNELDQWSRNYKDPFEGFAINSIKSIVLKSAIDFIDEHIQNQFDTAKLSRMTPGSLKDWPITEQSTLFKVLGDVESAIGVCLMDSLMMKPEQSVSGIIFPTDIQFESCQLCPRESCPSRRADFEKHLLEKKYKKK